MLQQYEIAHEQFKNKYKQLPGDTNLFPITGFPSRTDANDKRIIAAANEDSYKYEIAFYWKHLFQGGMIQKDYQTDATTGLRAGIHVPETPYKGAGLYPYTWVYDGSTMLNATKWKFFYGIADYSALTNNSPYSGVGVIPTKNFVTSVEAAAIDNKMDDGLAYKTPASAAYDIGSEIEKMSWTNFNSVYSCNLASDPTKFDLSHPNDKTCMMFYMVGDGK